MLSAAWVGRCQLSFTKKKKKNEKVKFFSEFNMCNYFVYLYKWLLDKIGVFTNFFWSICGKLSINERYGWKLRTEYFS